MPAAGDALLDRSHGGARTRHRTDAVVCGGDRGRRGDDRRQRDRRQHGTEQRRHFAWRVEMPNALSDGFGRWPALLFFVGGFHRMLILALASSLAVAPLGVLSLPDPGIMIDAGRTRLRARAGTGLSGDGSAVRAVDRAGSDRAARSASQHSDRRAGGDGDRRAGPARARRDRSRRRRSCAPGSGDRRNRWDGSMADRDEKTFPALPQKRERAREQGQNRALPRSDLGDLVRGRDCVLIGRWSPGRGSGPGRFPRRARGDRFERSGAGARAGIALAAVPWRWRTGRCSPRHP